MVDRFTSRWLVDWLWLLTTWRFFGRHAGRFVDRFDCRMHRLPGWVVVEGLFG